MKTKAIIWLSIVFSFIGTLLVYPVLPQVVPVHWNVMGYPDGFSPKRIVIYLSIIPIFMYHMLIYLPNVDPKKDKLIKQDRTYVRMTACIIFTMLSIHWLVIMTSVGKISSTAFFVRIIIGILLIIIGRYLKNLKMNYFAGIKLPWTLASEEVWVKTHRIAGRGFLVIGVYAIITAVLHINLSFYLFMGLSLTVILFTMYYSYWLSRNSSIKS